MDDTIPTAEAVTPRSAGAGRSWPDALPVCVVLLLLGAANIRYGAFSISRWGPLAVFVLLLVAAFTGARRPAPSARIPVIAIWAFALWSAASLAWAQAPATAAEGVGRQLLYAALFTLPVITLRRRTAARWAADLAVGVLAAIVAGMLVAMVIDARSLYLAGRIESPIAYRNGTAALFVMAFWALVCVAASRRVRVALRPPALALATGAAGLAFLTQSRGTLIGLVAGAIVALALGPERVRRVFIALLALGPIALVSHRLLQPYDVFSATYVTSRSAIATAERALFVAIAIALAIGLVVVLVDRALKDGGRVRAAARTGSRVLLGLIAAAALVAAIVAMGSPSTFVRDKVDEFTAVVATQDGGATRLGSVGGQRYDLWRIAVREFGDHPLAGVGESSYSPAYYLLRRTDLNLEAAHSFPLGVLAELGVVGVLLFGVFIISWLVGLLRGLGGVSAEDRRRATTLAAVAGVFFGQAAVDWFWTIPGLAGFCVVLLGIALALVAPAVDAPARAGGGARVVRTLPALGLGLCALFIAAQVLSGHEMARARAAATPQSRLDHARAAERLNPFALAPRYAQAGALEALGRTDAAQAELRGALDLQPGSFVTLGLLGDAATRRGDRVAARRWYRRALRRNPADVGLQQLAGLARHTSG